MKNKIVVMSVAAIFSYASFAMAGQGMLANGITLQSNAGDMTITCNNVPGNININSSPSIFSWINFIQKWSNAHILKCMFYNDGQRAVGATISIQGNSGKITNISTYDGYPQPTIMPRVGIYAGGISITLNPPTSSTPKK